MKSIIRYIKENLNNVPECLVNMLSNFPEKFKVDGRNFKDVKEYYHLKDICLSFWDDSNILNVDMIRVNPKEKRSGWGTKFFNDLFSYCDEKKWRVSLDPCAFFGTPLSVLQRYYKKLGFRDCSEEEKEEINKDMIREPK